MRQRIAKFCLMLCALWMATGIMAQATTGDVYRLGPDDVIRIQVFQENELAAVVRVGRDGNIVAPFAGTIRAEGKTTAELEEDLRRAYISRLGIRDPVVSVTIEVFRSIRASVSGLVNRPGTYEVRFNDSVFTLLSYGGGQVLDGRADLRRATLRRSGSREQIPIDLYSMLVQGDLSQDFPIQDGDILNIPEEERNRVVIFGEIAQPGVYPYREPMRLSDLIGLGRDRTGRSKFSDIVIIRENRGSPGDYVRIRTDYVRFLTRGDSSQNVELQPGDIVFVPDNGNLNFALINSIANLLFVLDRTGIRFLDDLLPGRR